MDKFDYTYKAINENERKEIEYIKRQYQPHSQANALERLRKLDNKVKGWANALSLVCGVVGILLFGGGLALVLEFAKIAPGIVLCVLSIPPIALAYPLYKKVLARGKAKYGDEILALSEQLLGENKTNE
ncbi:MAG: hypothetical protein E7344_00435 [Clostridiales bacterium]|nr:hypothetical protein [Clostridiales bacterium]